MTNSPRSGLSRRPGREWSGAGEVVAEIFLALVAEEGDEGAQFRVALSLAPGSEQVCAGTGADEQPVLASQAAHLGDRGVAVHCDDLIDHLAVPGEDAGNEAVGDALDEVLADLSAHQRA